MIRRRHHRLLATAALAAILAALGLAGCGIPEEGSARAIGAGNVPFGLLDATTSTSLGAPAVETGASATVEVFLLGPDGRLVPASRRIGTPVSLVNVIGELLKGPSTGEQGADYQSLISTQTKLLGAQVIDGVANIDVSQEFLEVTGNAQILAIAQIVYTATGVEGVSSVRFYLEGRPAEVPIQDGTQTARPLTRNDYTRLGPP